MTGRMSKGKNIKKTIRTIRMSKMIKNQKYDKTDQNVKSDLLMAFGLLNLT